MKKLLIGLVLAGWCGLAGAQSNTAQALVQRDGRSWSMVSNNTAWLARTALQTNTTALLVTNITQMVGQSNVVTVTSARTNVVTGTGMLLSAPSETYNGPLGVCTNWVDPRFGSVPTNLNFSEGVYYPERGGMERNAMGSGWLTPLGPGGQQYCVSLYRNGGDDKVGWYIGAPVTILPGMVTDDKAYGEIPWTNATLYSTPLPLRLTGYYGGGVGTVLLSVTSGVITATNITQILATNQVQYPYVITNVVPVLVTNVVAQQDQQGNPVVRWTVLAASNSVPLYPVFRLHMNDSRAVTNFTDFALIGSTDNFQTICYAVCSRTNVLETDFGAPSTTWQDTAFDFWFLDDYSTDPRVYRTTEARDQFVFGALQDATHGYVGSIVVSPPQLGSWLSPQNTKLVWAYCRWNQQVNAEQNRTGTAQHWIPVRPTWQFQQMQPPAR